MTPKWSELKAAVALSTIAISFLAGCPESVSGISPDGGEEAGLPGTVGGGGGIAAGGSGGGLMGGRPGGKDGAGAQGGTIAGTAPPVAPGYKLDVLFVVGKTQSMADAQRRLAAAAPAFVAELRRRQVDDVRIGVLSAHVGMLGYPYAGDPLCDMNVGDKDKLLGEGTCLPKASFLQIAGGSANATDVGGALGCMLKVGTAGCVFSMPVNSFLSFSITDDAKTEGGFLRYDAELLVVVVSDEDDCSMGGTQDVRFFQHRPGQFRRLRCATAGHICNKTVLEPREQSVPLAQCESFWTGGDMLVLIREKVVPELEEILDTKRRRRAFFKSGAPEPRVMFAALSGWPSEANLANARYEYKQFTSSVTGESLVDIAPLCGEGPGVARAGLRLRDLTQRLGRDGLYLSVCGDDLRPALVQVAGLP